MDVEITQSTYNKARNIKILGKKINRCSEQVNGQLVAVAKYRSNVSALKVR